MTRPLIVLADYPRLRKKGHRYNSSRTRARSPCRRYIETDRIQGERSAAGRRLRALTEQNRVCYFIVKEII